MNLSNYSYSNVIKRLDEIAKLVGRDYLPWIMQEDPWILMDIEKAKAENWEAYIDTRTQIL